MSRWFISMSIAAASTALLATACNAGNMSSANKMSAAKGDYIKTAKPGAAVQFSQMNDNKATGMESREITVQITNGYDSGILTVNVINNDKLAMSGAAGSYTFDMSGSAPHEITVSVNPLVTGIHYLNFNAVAEYGQGQVARAQYGVPIYAGVQPQKANVQNLDAPKTSTGTPGIIVMDAEETIITKSPNE